MSSIRDYNNNNNNEQASLTVSHQNFVGETEWSRRQNKVLNRKKGVWNEKLQASIQEQTKRLDSKHEELLGAYSKYFKFKLEPFEEPLPYSILEENEVRPFRYCNPLYSNYLCYVCWKTVPAGASRISCHTCPCVSHQHCVIDLAPLLLSRAVSTHNAIKLQTLPSISNSNSPNKNSSQFQKLFYNENEIDNDEIKCYEINQINEYGDDISPLPSSRKSSTSSPNKSPATTPRLISQTTASVLTPTNYSNIPSYNPSETWQCPFCIETLQSNNVYMVKKYVDSRLKYLQYKYSIVLQSFGRMIPKYKNFKTAKKGFIWLQRYTRKKQFWAKNLREKARVLQPFKIRISDIPIIFKIRKSEVEEDDDDMVVPLPESRKLGEIVTTMYEQIFCIKKNVNLTDSEISLDPETIKIFSQGYSEVPVYQQTYSDGKEVESKSVFLTITVESMIDDKKCQIYRLDIPLSNNGKQIEITRKELRLMSIVDINDKLFERMQKNYRIIKCYPPKPYILIPACNANTNLVFTISQVEQWPKAFIMGQTVQDISPYLIWKKTAVHKSGFDTEIDFEVPSVQDDNGCKINISEKPIMSSKKLKNFNYCRPKNKKLIASVTDTACFVAEAALMTWTLMTVSYQDANHASRLISYDSASIGSGKKIVWCILIDHVLSIFRSGHFDMIPLESIELKSTFVSLLDDGVIKVKASSHSVFLGSDDIKESKRWFEKLYNQSNSITLKKFNESMLKGFDVVKSNV